MQLGHPRRWTRPKIIGSAKTEPGGPFAGRGKGLMWLKLKHVHPCASHGVLTPWIFLKASISPQDFITASNDAVIARVGQQAPSLICISQGPSSVQAARVCTELSTTGIQSWLHSVVAVLIQVIINNNGRLEINLLCLVHDWSFSLVEAPAGKVWCIPSWFWLCTTPYGSVSAQFSLRALVQYRQFHLFTHCEAGHWY